MFGCKEVLVLLLAMTLLTQSKRTKRMIKPGAKAPVKPVRSAVAIVMKTDGKPFCSGTLITDTMVLTSARCLSQEDLFKIQVVAGEMNLVRGKNRVTRNVKSLRKHPNYKCIKDKGNKGEREQLVDADLALLELDHPYDLKNEDNIEKAELPIFSMKLTNKFIQIGGWGRTTEHFTSVPSPDFLAIDIPVKTSMECSQTYTNGTYFPDRMFCAGLKGKTTCLGDGGGGALFHGWGGVPIVVGVVSVGRQDCDTASIFTRVDKYLPWIFSQTQLKPQLAGGEEMTCPLMMKMRDNFLQDLSQQRTVLYLSDSKVVSVPSFQAVEGCPLPPYPETGIGYAVTGIVNNRLFVCGGTDEKRAMLSSCYSLDHGRWWLQQPLSSERTSAAASLSPLGLMVTGGYADERRQASTEVLTPTGWIPGPALPEAKFGHCQISIGSVVITIGGDTGSATAAVRALDKDKNTWTPLASMHYARVYHACTVIGNNIMVLGGHGAPTSVEFYDMLEDEWTAGPDLDKEMTDGHATVYEGRLFAVYSDGLVMEMAGDRTAWTQVANIGSWYVGLRPVLPPTLLSEEMLGC